MSLSNPPRGLAPSTPKTTLWLSPLLKPLLPAPEPAQEREACFFINSFNKSKPSCCLALQPCHPLERLRGKSPVWQPAGPTRWPRFGAELILLLPGSCLFLSGAALALSALLAPFWFRKESTGSSRRRGGGSCTKPLVGVAALTRAGWTRSGLRQPGKCQMMTPRQLQHPGGLLVNIIATR